MMKSWVCLIKFDMGYLRQKRQEQDDPFETIKLHQCGSMCTNPKTLGLQAITGPV